MRLEPGRQWEWREGQKGLEVVAGVGLPLSYILIVSGSTRSLTYVILYLIYEIALVRQGSRARQGSRTYEINQDSPLTSGALPSLCIVT